jgi:hypothetical protein
MPHHFTDEEFALALNAHEITALAAAQGVTPAQYIRLESAAACGLDSAELQNDLQHSLAEYAAGLAVLARAELVVSAVFEEGTPAGEALRQALLGQLDSDLYRLPAGARRWQWAGLRAVAPRPAQP